LLSPAAIRRHLCGVTLSATEIRQAVRAALAEDIGGDDATTLATVPANATAKAVMRAREPLIVAGIEFAEILLAGSIQKNVASGWRCPRDSNPI
jgi:nicotinate-nucleotide pyrophosphorylase (carboxylating)